MAETRNFQGTVTRTSQYGFQLNGQDQWFNYGNKYQGLQPQKDQVVRVAANPYGDNGKLYVAKVDVDGGGQSSSGSRPSGNGGGSRPYEDRSAGINRAVALKAAVDSYSNDSVEDDDILRRARVFEGWLNRTGSVEAGFPPDPDEIPFD